MKADKKHVEVKPKYTKDMAKAKILRELMNQWLDDNPTLLDDIDR